MPGTVRCQFYRLGNKLWKVIVTIPYELFTNDVESAFSCFISSHDSIRGSGVTVRFPSIPE